MLNTIKDPLTRKLCQLFKVSLEPLSKKEDFDGGVYYLPELAEELMEAQGMESNVEELKLNKNSLDTLVMSRMSNNKTDSNNVALFF